MSCIYTFATCVLALFSFPFWPVGLGGIHVMMSKLGKASETQVTEIVRKGGGVPLSANFFC